MTKHAAPELNAGKTSDVAPGPSRLSGCALSVGWFLLLVAFMALSATNPKVSHADYLTMRIVPAGVAFLLLLFVCMRGTGFQRIAATLGVAVFVFIALCAFRIL